jgi:subfamily B ATP-binding cassette protein MsbA
LNTDVTNRWAKLAFLIRGHKRHALLLFVVMVLAAGAEGLGLSLVLPLLSALVGLEGAETGIDRYTDFLFQLMPEAWRVEGLLVALTVAFLLKAVLMILHRGMTVHFAMRLREYWSTNIFNQYMAARYRYLVDQKQGVLINNAVIEPSHAAKAITMLLELLCRVILCSVLLLMMVITDWVATTALLLVGLVVMVALREVSARFSIRFGKERLRLNQEITAMAAEGIGGIKEIKIFGVFRQHLEALAAKLARYTQINTRFAVLSEMPRHVMEFLAVFLIAAVLIALRIMRPTELKAIIPMLAFFVLVCQRLVIYISYIIAQRMKVASFLPSLVMIYDLIRSRTIKEETDTGQSIEAITTDIVFKDIQFGYTSSSEVFQQLNLRIAHGQMTALVGPSGIGKSTIADLLLRLIQPQGGSIEANGKPIGAFDLQSWRMRIGYVSQEPTLFNASIRDNIRVGLPQASEDQVVEAARMANIHDFIVSLSKGYDTQIGDRGVKLSGGQRQRIAIARAIIRQPDLYIFDEATSSLDRESEKSIQQSIETLARDKTILVIAHRLTTLEKADVIYQMTSGGELQRKTYRELET